MLEEPIAGNPHGGVCGGCAGKPAHLPGEKAETIIAFQKKLSEMLGIPLERKESDETC